MTTAPLLNGIVQDIFGYVEEAVMGFIDVMAKLFADDGILSIFYDTEDGLTILGGLLILGFSVALVRWAFGFVKSLLKLRG